jgi:hypothetical protein
VSSDELEKKIKTIITVAFNAGNDYGRVMPYLGFSDFSDDIVFDLFNHDSTGANTTYMRYPTEYSAFFHFSDSEAY